MWINYKGEVKNVEDFYAQQLVDKGKAEKVEQPTNDESKPQKPEHKKVSNEPD